MLAAPPLYCTAGRTPPPPRPSGNDEDGDARPAALRVVIVDDELMVAWMLQSQLEALGFEVVELFASGEAALAEIDAIAPDMVMMDINLGDGLDGIETARLIRDSIAVRVLFVSAYDDEGTRARIAAEVPGAHFLGKPVFAASLAAAIANAAGLH